MAIEGPTDHATRLCSAAAVSRVAGELHALRELALEIEGHLGMIVSAQNAVSPATMKTLQELDRIVQTLGDLAKFLAALSNDMPMGFEIDAAPAFDELRLQSLAARLRASLSGGIIADCPSEPELF